MVKFPTDVSHGRFGFLLVTTLVPDPARKNPKNPRVGDLIFAGIFAAEAGEGGQLPSFSYRI